MAEALEYLAAAVIDDMGRSSATIDSFLALRTAIGVYGLQLDDKATDVLARRLEQLGFLTRVTDHYAGTYFVPLGGMIAILRANDIRKADPNSTLAKALSGGKSLFKRVFDNPAFWSDLAEQLNQGALPSQPSSLAPVDSLVPASDRIVKLSHNQQAELESSSTELIGELGKENSVDGDADLKDRLLGQIRAARELIRAQSVRAYLLYEMVFSVLVSLVERYKGQAIGHAAKKLLDLFIESVFKNNA